MIKKSILLADCIRMSEDIETLYDCIDDLKAMNVALATKVTMALSEIRKLRGEYSPDE